MGISIEYLIKPKLWHPSEVWEWFRKNKRHSEGGNGFISYPDYKKRMDNLDGQLLKTLISLDKFESNISEDIAEEIRAFMKTYTV